MYASLSQATKDQRQAAQRPPSGSPWFMRVGVGQTLNFEP